MLWIDAGTSTNPYAPYRVYRKAGGGAFVFQAETTDHVCVDSSAVQNGTTYYYKVRALNSSGLEGPESDEVLFQPTSQNPTCTATILSDTGLEAATGALRAECTGTTGTVQGMAFCVDAEYVDQGEPSLPLMQYNSEAARNGLTTAAVVVWDDQGRYGFTNTVHVTFDNEFSITNVSDVELNPDNPGEQVIFMSRFKASYSYTIKITNDRTGTIVRTITGSQPVSQVSMSWDGLDTGGQGVEDDSYSFTVTVNTNPQHTSPKKRVEVGRADPSNCRAVIVNTLMYSLPDVGYFGGFERVEAVRAACKAAGLTFKVFQPGNAYWEDYGQNGSKWGIASFVRASYSRMFYFFGHGNHEVENGVPNPGFSTLIWMRRYHPARNPRAIVSSALVQASDVHALGIPDNKLKFVWLDACGTGRRQASCDSGNIETSDAWKKISSSPANDMAKEFGIGAAEYFPEKASYYLGYWGKGYMNTPYTNMVKRFFEKFSQSAGTLNTILAVMNYLSSQPEVIDHFNGNPFIDFDEPHWWLVYSPPFYNVRVFTNSWTATAPDYTRLKMADMR